MLNPRSTIHVTGTLIGVLALALLATPAAAKESCRKGGHRAREQHQSRHHDTYRRRSHSSVWFSHGFHLGHSGHRGHHGRRHSWGHRSHHHSGWSFGFHLGSRGDSQCHGSRSRRYDSRHRGHYGRHGGVSIEVQCTDTTPHYEEERRWVPGHYETHTEEVCTSTGRYETRSKRVWVPGRWETYQVAYPHRHSPQCYVSTRIGR